ncbi:UNVERIFIED_CONTAM: Raucaffricine-O-beta-D-glucosidase [Sesamum calycinum]|uniref:Raucaffricine-O-beta-D-glucosidase n=1 Tax=Sesamum calycinum TaxID=2727403 RepID=A0AAW2NH32_9LAMI
MQANNVSVHSVSMKNRQDNSSLTRKDFGDGFIFGVGTSAFQVEGAAARGGKSISVWDDLTLRTPSDSLYLFFYIFQIFHKVLCIYYLSMVLTEFNMNDLIEGGTNGNVACDTYNRYKEDIKLMKQMGFDSYRFSISWPRILPGGRCCAGINKEGIDYYNDVIDTVIAHGMIPFVTLFHWDLPNCLQLEYGGMLSKKVVNDFVEFAEICFAEFGDRIYQEGQIGIVLNTCNHYRFNNTSKEDKDAAERATDIMIGWFLEPVIHGQYPESMCNTLRAILCLSQMKKKKSLRNLLIGWV